MNITDPIRRFARLRPDSVAVVHANGAALSYRDLDRMVDASAARLLALGLRAGHTVGLRITGPEGLRFLVLSLALARLGIVSTEAAMPDASLEACLVSSDIAPRPGVRAIPADEAWDPALPPEKVVAPAPMVRDGSAVCRVFASSGTTGEPKFAAISHELLFRRVSSNVVSMGVPPSAHLCAVGYGITLGFTSILRTFWFGRTLVIANPAQTLDAIQRHHVTSMVISPMALQTVVAAIPDGQGPLPSLRVVEVGGSMLPSRLGEVARQKLCANIVDVFGSVETGVIASGEIADFGGDFRVSGVVHAGVEVEAVDAEDNPLPPGGEGVLRVRGTTTISGYMGDDAVSSRIFRGGWFYSGDVGMVSAEGVLRLTGRTSDVINSGGTKLSPHAVEDVLLGIAGVTDAAVFGVPDAMGLIQVWAAIVGPTPVDGAVLNTVCREKLREKAPKFIVQVNTLPRNANGKVLREELVKFAIARMQAARAAAKPAAE